MEYCFNIAQCLSRAKSLRFGIDFFNGPFLVQRTMKEKKPSLQGDWILSLFQDLVSQRSAFKYQ